MKLLVILGPTASGKSALAVAKALELNGEIVSCDSRQVYQGLDIGSGKVTAEEMQGITHHIVSIAAPESEYNVSHFLTDARKAIADIESRGKLPILCGGTTFWARALLLGESLPEVAPNLELRSELKSLTTPDLFQKLQILDPSFAEKVDRKNPHRLIRAIEIATALGSVPERTRNPFYPASEVELVILKPTREELREKITQRLDQRLDHAPVTSNEKVETTNSPLIQEVQGLLDQGVGADWLLGLGLEYTWVTRYLQGDVSYQHMRSELIQDIVHYAKRQETFLRKLERDWQILTEAV
jgi:tRNA dimethylallyltransferase